MNLLRALCGRGYGLIVTEAVTISTTERNELTPNECRYVMTLDPAPTKSWWRAADDFYRNRITDFGLDDTMGVDKVIKREGDNILVCGFIASSLVDQAREFVEAMIDHANRATE